jgi:S-adenosylmethionine decarboxylase
MINPEKPFPVHRSAFAKSKTTNVSSIPGLHIIANFSVEGLDKISTFAPFQNFIKSQIQHHNLCSVGEVFHDFENGGYTAVVCLTESHLSIHTWPENHYLTFDIFLSNYLKDNREITRQLYKNVKRYFNATVLFEQIIDR